MTRDLGAHPIALSRLIEGVSGGSILLPEFQRTFDWSTSDIRSLLATVLMSWPAGSLLLMNGPPDFALRPLYGAPPKSTRVDFVVLDGQQRLTSLYHALAGAGDDAWVLDAKRLPKKVSDATVDDLEEAIYAVEREAWDTQYPLRRQAVEHVVPLYSLSSPSDYFEWRDNVTEEAPATDRRELRGRLTDLYKNLLSRIHDYSFPAVVLQSELPIEAISRIFERINRTGLRLTTFDLMVARTYSSGWNLREEWEQARVEYPILTDFFDDGLPALQIVSLVSPRSDIRQPAVLQMDPVFVQQHFGDACRSLSDGLQWLVSSCGVRSPTWVPYGIMPIVVGSLAFNERPLMGDTQLTRWFWLSVLTQRFDVASSTLAASDYQEFLSGSEPEFAALDSGHLTVVARPLLDATKRKMGAFWRGFSCALGVDEIRDVLDGESLLEPTSELLQQRSRTTSLYPRRESGPGRPSLHLRVLSSFIATSDTSRRLGGKPEAWSDADSSPQGLASQLLPVSTAERIARMDPEELLLERLHDFLDFVASRSQIVIEVV